MTFTSPLSLLTSRECLNAYRTVGRVRFVNNNKLKLGLAQTPYCLEAMFVAKGDGGKG